MNISRSSLALVALPPRLRLIFAASCLAGLVRAADAPPEPKTYVMFQGASVTLEQDGKLCPVVDIAGDTFVVRSAGKEVPVSSKGASKMRVVPATKLTEASATIQKYAAERAFTPENDPDVAFQRSLMQAARLNADNQAFVNQSTAGFKMGSASASVAAGAGARNPALGALQAQGTQSSQQQATLETQRIAGGPGSSLQLNRGETEGGPGYDAIKVDFEVTSPRLLGRPFIVITAQYRAPGTAAGTFANWVYAKALRPIEAKPTKVHVEQGGFPFGFEFQDLQVHLYDGGEEIATNLSAKRVEMTQSEAHRQVVNNYIATHKNATLPAAPMMGHLPPDLAARLAKGEMRAVVYVKVSPDGRALDSYGDQDCTAKLDDPYLNAVVGRLYFRPALASGQPVEGVTAVDFTKLAI